MHKSIGMLELNSIARGIECCDVIIKAADVNIIRASTVCPGKYIVLFAGDTGAVKAALGAGESRGEHYVVDRLRIPNINPQLIPGINGIADAPAQPEAIGAIEFYSISAAIIAADEAAKAANITLIEVKIGYAIGGKGIVVLTGTVGDVRAAVAAAVAKTEETGYLMNFAIIPKPAKELYESLL